MFALGRGKEERRKEAIWLVSWRGSTVASVILAKDKLSEAVASTRSSCLSRQRLYSESNDDTLVLTSCLTGYLGSGRGWGWGEITGYCIKMSSEANSWSHRPVRITSSLSADPLGFFINLISEFPFCTKSWARNWKNVFLCGTIHVPTEITECGASERKRMTIVLWTRNEQVLQGHGEGVSASHWRSERASWQVFWVVKGRGSQQNE